MTVAAIVPAAGTGRRFGGGGDKLFAPLSGRPLLAHTLAALQRAPAIRWIQVVVQATTRQRVAQLIARERITKALPLCLGGASRADSVFRGFAALPRQAEWVLVHDAARPCLTPALIQRCLQEARRHGAVGCGLPASVTVKAVDGARHVRLTLDRERLWFAQTPQAFRRDWFAEAVSRANGTLDRFPDDVSLLEAAGFPVRMVPGDPLNVKVTTREDLVLAEATLRRRR